jgi:hypothetical protein
MYFYSYTLVNDPANKGAIGSFQLNISKLPNSVQYDTVGLLFSGEYSEECLRDDFPAKVNEVVPVGCPRLPTYWTATLGNGPLLWLDVDTASSDFVEGLVARSPTFNKCSLSPLVWIGFLVTR